MFGTQESSYTVPCILAATACIVTWYVRRNKPKTPTLHHVDSNLHRHVLKTKPKLTSPYSPPFFLQNNHVQTIVANFLSKAKVNFTRQYQTLKDGGTLALDWVADNLDSLHESSTVMIVLPGLTAGRDDMGELCSRAAGRGYRVVVFNKRGHGDSVLKTPKLQGFGDASDFRICVEYIKNKFSSAIIVAVGSSAGSGLLASYLGEYGDQCLLATCVCSSPGYDALKLFGKGMSPFYETRLIASMKNILRKHADILSPLIDLNAAYSAKTFTEFDTHVYCKIYGHADYVEYWKYNNPMRDIMNVSIPILCINSMDDPICSADNIPFHMFKEKSDCMLITTDKGGHCGFLEGWELDPWADIVALDYIDAVLEFQMIEDSPESLATATE